MLMVSCMLLTSFSLYLKPFSVAYNKVVEKKENARLLGSVQVY